jgi:hypothetical protein
VPGEDQDEHELPDQPRREEDEQGLTQRFIAPESVAEPWGNDPRKNGHRDGGCRPHAEDLSEGVLLYAGIPDVLLRRVFRHHCTLGRTIKRRLGREHPGPLLPYR